MVLKPHKKCIYWCQVDSVRLWYSATGVYQLSTWFSHQYWCNTPVGESSPIQPQFDEDDYKLVETGSHWLVLCFHSKLLQHVYLLIFNNAFLVKCDLHQCFRTYRHKKLWQIQRQLSYFPVSFLRLFYIVKPIFLSALNFHW